MVSDRFGRVSSSHISAHAFLAVRLALFASFANHYHMNQRNPREQTEKTADLRSRVGHCCNHMQRIPAPSLGEVEASALLQDGPREADGLGRMDKAISPCGGSERIANEFDRGPET